MFSSNPSTPVALSTPVDSEKFLAPTLTEHKDGDDEMMKNQNPDRERTTCALALEVHYELNVLSDETGAAEPRMKPFNPAKHSPACTYNWTGKFIKEKDHILHQRDPVALGRLIEKEDPYDPALYAKKDPRLLSQTVVVRDYGCKIPIDIADTQKIAQAVLNDYPDKYVSYLGNFVSALFGNSMRAFLDKQIAGYKAMLANTDELNRVAWGSYISIQGGIDPSQANVAKKTSNYDCTLPYNQDIANSLNQLTREGVAMTGKVSSKDVYDLEPCIQQHIQTLTMMKDEWCHGFGSKEAHVLAMLWYANDQGRNLQADLRLMAESDSPQYDKVGLVVPVNFYEQGELNTGSAKQTQPITEPDENSSVRAGLVENARGVYQTTSTRIPVGNWSGNSDTANVFLGVNAKAPIMWGWGHPSNLAIRQTGTRVMMPYIFHDEAGRVQVGKFGKTYVQPTKWFANKSDVKDEYDKVIEGAAPMRRVSLRESLDDQPQPPHIFRGSHALEKNTYRAAALPTQSAGPARVAAGAAIVPETKIFAERQGTRHGLDVCSGGECISVLDPALFQKCEYLDPFVRHGGECFKMTEGGLKFSPKFVSPYKFSNYKDSALLNKIFPSTSTTRDLRTFLQIVPTASTRVDDLYEDSKATYTSGHWPLLTLTTVADAERDSAILAGQPFPTTRDEYKQWRDSVTSGIPGPGGRGVVVDAPIFELDMTGQVIPDTDLSLDMHEVPVAPQIKRGLQILLLRKTVQYAFGMDVALAICAEPFDTRVAIGAARSAPARALHNRRWKQVGMPGKWEGIDKTINGVVRRVLELQSEDGTPFGPEKTQALVFDYSYKVMLKRLKAFRDKNVSEIRKAVNTGAHFASRTQGDHQIPPLYHELPTELIFQKSQDAYDKTGNTGQDPRLLFAGTVTSYIEQLKKTSNVDFTEIAPTMTRTDALPIFDEFGYTVKMSSNASKELDKYMDVCTTAFDEAMKKRCGLSTVIDNFLSHLPEDGFRGAKTFRAAQTSADEDRNYTTDISYPAFPGAAPGVPAAQRLTVSNGNPLCDLPGTLKNGGNYQFRWLPVSMNPDSVFQSLQEKSDKDELTKYNRCGTRPQLFAMLDASALLWNAREFFNPADTNRPNKDDVDGGVDDMHYWSRTYVETFLHARELYKFAHKDRNEDFWEWDVKHKPMDALPPSLIGSMSEESWRRYFLSSLRIMKASVIRSVASVLSM